MPSLRFVEINGHKQNIEILENLPSQIVGHKGEIKPQITNGHISRHHATVCYDAHNESWLVIDGDAISGATSKNGLKSINGEVIKGKITLREVGDRVYLLYLYDTNAYLEVFATNQEKMDSTSGIKNEDVKPEIDKLVVNTSLIKGEVIRVSEVANSNASHIAKVDKIQTQLSNQVKETLVTVTDNAEHLDKIDKTQDDLSGRLDAMMSILDRGLNQVEDIGNKPKQFILGFTIFSMGAIFIMFTYGVYRNLDPIVKNLFQLEQVNTDKK